jgi:AraC-like DNA-binding protein
MSAAAAGIDDFGLRLAEKRTLANLGPLGLFVRDQPTVRQGIEAWIQNRKLHTDSVSLRIEERDGNAVISLVLFVETPALTRQVVEMTVGVVYRTMRLFLGDGWRPRVCFAHNAPRNRDIHRRVFGGSAEFNGDFNGIACRSSDLDSPIVAADPAMARYVPQYVDSIMHTTATFGEKVRELVNLMLPSGDCRMKRIAEHLGVDRKTVRRRLAEEETSFSAIVDAVRTELVNRYIDNRERPLGVVAEMLGFSYLSAFSRWFKKRFGRDISAWRLMNQTRGKSQTVQWLPGAQHYFLAPGNCARASTSLRTSSLSAMRPRARAFRLSFADRGLSNTFSAATIEISANAFRIVS